MTPKRNKFPCIHLYPAYFYTSFTDNLLQGPKSSRLVHETAYHVAPTTPTLKSPTWITQYPYMIHTRRSWLYDSIAFVNSTYGYGLSHDTIAWLSWVVDKKRSNLKTASLLLIQLYFH